MAFIVADRVQETSTSPGGTGTINLAGAIAGFKSFATGVGTGNTTYYCIVDNSTGVWEVGTGTYTTGSPNTLSRTTVYSNSSGTTANISFTNGNTLTVFCTYPATRGILQDNAGLVGVGVTPVTSKGTLQVGTIGYTDTGVVAGLASSVSGYNQVVLQNTSNNAAASTNFNISNDAGTTTTNYGELGINSSAFTGTGSFSQAGNVYLAAASTDLVVGTYAAKAIRFVVNNGATDALTISSAGASSFTGAVSSTANITGGYNNPAAGTTAMAFGSYNVVKVTPNATASFTTTVPAAGTQLTLIILTSGTSSYTITFSTGFKTTGTLATGTTTARYFRISFVSDGTNVLETARTVAIA